jgi:hypothetical protein
VAVAAGAQPASAAARMIKRRVDTRATATA